MSRPDTPVSTMCAPSYPLGYLYDFGAEWQHSPRVLPWTNPDGDHQLAPAQRPLLTGRPTLVHEDYGGRRWR
ncbi:hypothetical protein [Streptomyces sp. NBC_00212]|uniref:hypothetical protein n=1 Tax=Streptomyces sp. NBC_00212 TaxID=2975684 RepID=UPI003251097C